MLNRIRRMREKKGFTLVELIVVIAIIAILTAVIVPLVGRYSAQATYTTLQDAAKTVSTSANNVISDITMMGKVYKQKVIAGSKVNGGTISITISADSAISLVGSSDDGAVLVPMDDAAAVTDPLDSEMETKLKSALQDALPNNAYFAIVVGNNTVKGVIYTTDSGLGDTIAGLTTEADVTGQDVGPVDGFNEAYEVGTIAVGVQGYLIPPSTD